MDNKCKNLLIFGFIWSEMMVVYMITKESRMEFWQTLLIAVVPAIITGIITMVISKKSQLNKLSEQLDVMKKSFGQLEDKSLRSLIEEIRNDIGRGDQGSLSRQHEEVKDLTRKQFSEIKQRYEKEDESYRNFSRQQYDLKETMDNFLREYTTLSVHEKELLNENLKLKIENEKLLEENIELKEQIERDGRTGRGGR